MTRDRLTLVRDALGNETQFRYDAAGNLVEQTDARGNIWRYAYDQRHRLIESRDPQNGVTRYQYDRGGNLVGMIDPLGHTTRYEYDTRGRRTKSIDPDGGVTAFTYDLDNNLASLTDPVGNTTRFTYDSRSRQTAEIDPLGKAIQYTYDAADNLIRKTDRMLRETRYGYDALDRLVTELWVAQGTGTAIGIPNSIQYTYDLADNLVHVKDVFSELTFAYDAQNRMIMADNGGTPGAPHVVLTYTHDLVGNVTSVFDTIEGTPGASTGYVDDELHRLATLTQTAAPGATGAASVPLPSDKRVDFTYNPLGQYENIRRYKSLSATAVDLVIDTEYTYDSFNRIASIDHRNRAAEPVSFFHYQYDAASRITQITDIDGVTDYGYDDRNQLTAAEHSNSHSPDETYVYDANGNRIASHLHDSGYVTGPANRLLSDGTFNYGYDDEGNTILRTEVSTGVTRAFEWDYRNRLVRVTDMSTGGIITSESRYTYDALNRRTAKMVDNDGAGPAIEKKDMYVYDRDHVVLEFVDITEGSGILEQPKLEIRNLFGQGVDQIIAQEVIQRDGLVGGSQWLLIDHLGTVRDIVDDASAIINHILHDSFGNILSQNDSTVANRYYFTGREFDAESDLIYVRARYFDTSSGRFISEDHIQISVGDINLYRYSINSTINRRDPFGLNSEGTKVEIQERVERRLREIREDIKSRGRVAKCFVDECCLEDLRKILYQEGAKLAASQATKHAGKFFIPKRIYDTGELYRCAEKCNRIYRGRFSYGSQDTEIPARNPVVNGTSIESFQYQRQKGKRGGNRSGRRSVSVRRATRCLPERYWTGCCTVRLC